MIMIPRHLTGYHLLWFDLGTVLFLENPKIRQTLAHEPNPQFADKNPVHRYRNIIHILFTATGITMFHMYSQTAVRNRAFARSLWCC